MDISREVARALLQINAIGFNFEAPISFKSGILSPVYADNRKWPYYPHMWKMVIDGFVDLIKEKQLEFDIVAGIESAGIPHSAVLGYVMGKPSVFTRKAAKDHGTKRMVEGGDVRGKQVLLLEDLVTTGSSSLLGVDSLRAEGAEVNDCIVIVKYGFLEATRNFAKQQVTLHTLTDFAVILGEANKQKIITQSQKAIVESWVRDPWKWTRAHT